MSPLDRAPIRRSVKFTEKTRPTADAERIEEWFRLPIALCCRAKPLEGVGAMKRRSTFSLRRRVVTGALSGIALGVLSTRAWDLLSDLNGLRLLSIIPHVIGFALLGGWFAAISSLSRIDQSPEATPSKTVSREGLQMPGLYRLRPTAEQELQNPVLAPRTRLCGCLPG
jgi:hypothetical protein